MDSPFKVVVSELAFNPFHAFKPVLFIPKRRGSAVGYAIGKGRNPGKASATPPAFQRLKRNHLSALVV